MKHVNIAQWGTHSILLSWPTEISEGIHREVVFVSHWLQKKYAEMAIEIVPSYHSIALYFESTSLRAKVQKELPVSITAITSAADNSIHKNTYSLPVCYEEAFAPDLKQVADTLNMSISEIIALHTQPTYRVFGIGFLPGFPYLGGLAAKLRIPRKSVPSPQIRPGSVGLGGEQTGIYPSASPGGWHIIGNCPIPLFDIDRSSPALLQVGDRIKFRSITSEVWEDISEAINNNTFYLESLRVHD